MPLHSAARPVLALVPLVLLGAVRPVEVPVAAPEPALVLAPQRADRCLGEPPCAQPREIWIDEVATALPSAPVERVVYDVDEALRPVTAAELRDESELSVVVRLLVSEIGADRMIASRDALYEAVGILETVDNRLDPAFSNPFGVATAPDFPGCGPGGTFAGCANPGEYLGMATKRALAPDTMYAPDLLEQAADLAVAAWWLHRHGVITVTDGATSYVHRCGGTAYGMPTYRCDAHLGHPRLDLPGAEPHTGPILFRAPWEWLPRKGFYALGPVAWVDYDPVEPEVAVADLDE